VISEGQSASCTYITYRKVLLRAEVVKNFLDYIIVSSKDRDKHIKNRREVFKRLLSAGLNKIKKKRVFFSIKKTILRSY